MQLKKYTIIIRSAKFFIGTNGIAFAPKVRLHFFNAVFRMCDRWLVILLVNYHFR